MRKQHSLWLLLLFAVLFLAVPLSARAESVAINETNFPDAVFRKYILEHKDTNKNKILESGEAESDTYMEVPAGVKSVKGIVNFKNLEKLSFNASSFDGSEVTGLKKLTEIACWSSNMVSLDLSGVTSLKEFSYQGFEDEFADPPPRDRLNSLILPEGVVEVEVNNTSLTSLNLPDSVEELDCVNNLLKSLKCSKNMRELKCWSNEGMKVLDISDAPRMRTTYWDGGRSYHHEYNSSLFEYKCFDDELMMDPQTAVRLEKGGDLPEIRSITPTHIFYREGKNVTISVDASTPGDTYFSWFFCPFQDMEEVSGSTSSLNLTITPEMEGEGYRCQVFNEYGSVYSDIVFINKTLMFTKEPADVKGYIGSTVKFFTAVDDDEVSWQWQYLNTKGSNVWTDSQAPGANSDTLKVTVKESSAWMQYRCVVSHNSTGSTLFSKPAAVNVLTKITTQPVKVTKPVGDTAVYTVKATGAGLKYQWQVRNPNGANTWSNSGAPGNKTDTLRVAVKASYNKLQYRCVITDYTGKKTNSHYASLLVQPKITTQPVKVTKTVGETAVYTVKATGAGLKYQWQVRNPNGANTWGNSGASGNKTATLTVTVKESYNKLQYRCVITDANGVKINSSYASLIVATKITAQPVSKTVTSGSSYSFTVKATGAGLKYAWYYKAKGAASFTKSSVTIPTYANTAKPAVNGMQFYCEITDANGTKTKTNTVTLTVK